MSDFPIDTRCPFLLALCRPGFERECAEELSIGAARAGCGGRVESTLDAGWIRFVCDKVNRFHDLDRVIRLSSLTFARQLSFGFASVDALPEADRVAPLLEAARIAATPFSAILPEAADGAAGRPLAALGRRLAGPLERRFEKVHLLRPKRSQLPRLHVFFAEGGGAHLALSRADNASPWPMGIPRLRMPGDAPSRSTLKLAEALATLLGPDELAQRMRAGQRAVDLGAAPGGWSWQLARRGLRVTAVDNGPMAESVLRTEMVQHLRADGFTWRPAAPVDWMVCDMVDQPGRIAALVADWVAAGWCRHSVFNLKLPMKKRFAEVLRCRDLIHARLQRGGQTAELRLRQLYHDREEVTGFLEVRR